MKEVLGLCSVGKEKHIMALGGWKSAAMAKRYARVNPVELHDQIRTLEELPRYEGPAT